MKHNGRQDFLFKLAEGSFFWVTIFVYAVSFAAPVFASAAPESSDKHALVPTQSAAALRSSGASKSSNSNLNQFYSDGALSKPTLEIDEPGAMIDGGAVKRDKNGKIDISGEKQLLFDVKSPTILDEAPREWGHKEPEIVEHIELAGPKKVNSKTVKSSISFGVTPSKVENPKKEQPKDAKPVTVPQIPVPLKLENKVPEAPKNPVPVVRSKNWAENGRDGGPGVNQDGKRIVPPSVGSSVYMTTKVEVKEEPKVARDGGPAKRDANGNIETVKV